MGGELAFLPERTCAICYQDQNPTTASESEILTVSGASGGVIGSAQSDVTNPYETIPCGCIYCFVCLAQRLEAEEGEGWVCLRCGETVKECKPWSGAVLEEVSRPASRKSVVFSDEAGGEKGLSSVEPRPVDDGYQHDLDVSPTVPRGQLDDWARSGNRSQDEQGHQDTRPPESSHGS